jgi:hypothetical protein
LNEGSKYTNDLITLKHYIFSHKTKQRNLKRKNLQETPRFDYIFIVLHVPCSLLTVSVEGGMTSSQYPRLNVFRTGEVTKKRSNNPQETKSPKLLSLKGMPLLK